MTRTTRPRAQVYDPTIHKDNPEPPPPDIEKTAADELARQVPGAPAWKLLREVDAILKAWAANVKAKRVLDVDKLGRVRSILSAKDVIPLAQKIALHVDRLFTAMEELNVGEREPGIFRALDWRRAYQPLLEIALAACLIAPPKHELETDGLVKFITSFSTALPVAQAENRDRLQRHKPLNWPLGWAVASLVACFRRYNTVKEDAEVREWAFVLRALAASSLLPKKRTTARYSVERLHRDYYRKVVVDPRGFADWQP